MSIRQAMLAILEQGPMYGYQLRTEFEQRTGSTWPLNVGQVYTTLSRLERDGLVDDTGRFTSRKGVLQRMKGWGKVELRVLPYSPGFSLVVVDPDSLPSNVNHVQAVEVGGLLFGRRTYEDFYSFWPHQTDNPFTDVLNNTQKYVASTTLKDPEWANTTVLEGDLASGEVSLGATPHGDGGDAPFTVDHEDSSSAVFFHETAAKVSLEATATPF